VTTYNHFSLNGARALATASGDESFAASRLEPGSESGAGATRRRRANLLSQF
jgi:hypothetical protein